ncbi:MAG: DUF4288 domain-containing protein [Chitinophagaceae bacterium]
MNWYLAKMVFRIISGDGKHTAQFDEQLRLIRAVNREDAFQKGQTLGKCSEELYFNNREQPVQWQFISVSELYLLPELSDGTELYSRVEETEDAMGYLKFIYAKAGLIRFGSPAEILKTA